MFFEPHPEHYQKVEQTPTQTPLRFSVADQDLLLAEALSQAGVRSARLATPSMRTIALTVHTVDSGAQLPARRDSASRMFALIDGNGRFEVDGQVFACERGDIVAVPIWKIHSFAADAGTRLLEVSDEPVQHMLGFYREARMA
jgi:gentisate 1,2-dioxygenase